MKIKCLKIYNTSIAGLLVLLGFGACLNSGCAKYGTNTTDFILNGKVSSKETQQPIENIYVESEGRSMFTNHEGNYQLTTHASGYGDSYKTHIHFRDTSGHYKDLDTIIEFEKKKANDRTLNVQLTPKEDNN